VKALRLLCVCAGVCFGAGFGVFANAQDAVSPAKVKAAFLYNFALFVDWPASQPTGDFVIAVLGDGDVAQQLPAIVGGRTVHDRAVRVISLDSIAELDTAHILYVGSNALPSLPRIRSRVGRKPILIVSDNASRLLPGTVINLLTIDRRVRFEISLSTAQHAELRLSSRLLGAALRVDRDGMTTTGGAQ
jgi:hypothetical protein